MIGRRHFLSGSLGAALATGITTRGWGLPLQTDMILYNGRITTQAGPDVSAIALGGGMVVATGSDRQIRALRTRDVRMINLGGARVIPGLNDSHLHLTRQARFYNLELRWETVTSIAQGLRMIAEQAKRTPPGQWVRVVGGWSRAQMAEKRGPTVEELNAAAPDTPVIVLFLYSEAIVNRAGVKAMGLTSATVPPPPGKGMRYDLQNSGGAILRAEPYPQLLYKAIGDLPALTAADEANSARHWFRELNRLGLTSAVDAGGGGHNWPDDYSASDALAQSGELPLRIGNFLFAQRPGGELASINQWTQKERLDLNRATDLLEGFTVEGSGENLVASAGDYENFLSPRPDLAPAMEKELTAVVEVLARAQWPIRLHATYDESITRMLDVFEPVFKRTQYTARWAFDHAETISPGNIARVRALGGGISVQDRLAYAGEIFAERYGPAVAGNAPPLRAILASGMPLGAGTDGTRVSGYNPWMSLRWMTAGMTAGGNVIRPLEARLSRAEALHAFTLGSAWFSGDERHKGRLAPGQFADLAVLSDDYFSVADKNIAQISSMLTITGGQVVYGAGDFARLMPKLPPVSPNWSPVAHFGDT